ncbi:lipopolysaccharide/colanic/teichoic acid biosynthesis glycosyltransferase [Microvirga lupini]|uniref:Lipopolysaccharide/colanic/teichoic acid biosynthesis glycosyltransferase n=1 Tax=Microvirga lupini TaxID=420324 RepID=A0A7W4YXC6_9HYPH|nr:hypothetical protein [Microvirga lupini]MBB3019881.1 lipopolysaccharide/colanic/teichoic acid biosynthesis glycosyltransferase [Microvirga lupini]
MIKLMLRGTAAVLVIIGTLLWLWIALETVSDSDSGMDRSLDYQFAVFATAVFCIFVIPAGYLVYRSSRLPAALLLAIIPFLLPFLGIALLR